MSISFFTCKENENSTCHKPSTNLSFNGVESLGDLDSAIAYAKCVNKPLFVFFTGWSTFSCHKMEESVFPSYWIKKKLNNDFVMVSLFVDEQKPLKERYYSGYLKRVAETEGDKNFDYELSKFKSPSQPFFAILDTNQNTLGTIYYEPDKDKVKKHLDDALKLFNR